MNTVGTQRRSRSATAAPTIDRNAEAWSWQLSARCRGADPSMFFRDDGARGLKRRRRELKAKEFCAQCPVVMQCLHYSLTAQEPFGIWGGLTEDERGELLGRPRRVR
jgi:WhiB family transcriptional regulator, redox-sensing transcriptional regulator